MKKVKVYVIAAALCLCTSACGSAKANETASSVELASNEITEEINESASDQESVFDEATIEATTEKLKDDNEQKGTRSNPYVAGDSFTIENMKTYVGDTTDEIFTMNCTVEETYTQEQGYSMLPNFSNIPIAKLKIIFHGNYDDAVRICQFTTLDSNMTDMGPKMCLTMDFENVQIEYTENEYEIYVTTENPKIMDPEGKFRDIKYVRMAYQTVGERSDQYIYIGL